MKLLLYAALVVGLYQDLVSGSQISSTKIRRKRFLPRSCHGFSLLCFGSSDHYNLIRYDEGNQRKTGLVVDRSLGTISSHSRAQKKIAQKAIAKLPANLNDIPATAFDQNPLATEGSSTSGLRIDQQKAPSGYRNLAVQTNTRIKADSVNIAQALIPVSKTVLIKDVRRALLLSLDEQAVVKLVEDFYAGPNLRRFI